MTRTGLANNVRNYKTEDCNHNTQEYCHDVQADDTLSINSEVETVQSSLCCLQGCLAASAVGFAFFVGLPSGILLVFYASNINDSTLLIVGSFLIVLPVITLLMFVIGCLYKHRLQRLISGVKDEQKDAGEDNSKY